MSNKDQRRQNRRTAAKLNKIVREKQLAKHICENCGQTGGHWVSIQPTSLQGIISGVDDQTGYWTCKKL